MNPEENKLAPQDQQPIDSEEINPSDLEQVSGGLITCRKAGEKRHRGSARDQRAAKKRCRAGVRHEYPREERLCWFEAGPAAGLQPIIACLSAA